MSTAPARRRVRPPVSIVIPVWNEWALTNACLASLRQTLGVRDEVLVVDNGSVDGTADGLRRLSWVRVISHAVNRGFATGCNAGASQAQNEIIVFLNNDTLVAGRWLDGLVRPFENPSIVASGPRSNFVSGEQLVPVVDYDVDRPATLRRFAERWRLRHSGQISETERLVGFCLAVRRNDFEVIDGFDETFGIGGYEDDDLCRRLVARAGRLVIAHESFVHHYGHRTFSANGLDWYAVQEENRPLFEAKHSMASAALNDAAALLATGHFEAASATFAAARGAAQHITVMQKATDGLVRSLLAVGRTEELDVLVRELQQQGADPEYCMWLAAQGHAQAGRLDAALSLLDRLGCPVGPNGKPVESRQIDELRSLVVLLAETTSRAAG